MPGYRLRYQVYVDYTDSQGLGMCAAAQPNTFGPSLGPTFQFNQTICPGSATFTSTDINNLLTQMNTDLNAQMTVQQARIQNFASGGN